MTDYTVDVPWRIAALAQLDTARMALAEARKILPQNDAASDWLDDAQAAVDHARYALGVRFVKP